METLSNTIGVPVGILLLVGSGWLPAQDASSWVDVAVLAKAEGKEPVAVRDDDGGVTPVQRIAGDRFAFVRSSVPGAEDAWTPLYDDAVAVADQVTVERLEDRLRIHVRGHHFTDYRFRDGARPYFFPVLDAAGTSLSRH